ncbi:hypothetical protein BLNAU_9737 [Blattamonas nauphoetae]|uniref:Uncharacterized protein n=1 Tax=Blattamonas nauphoetae TaxID=2049346 RepID=A0ABQ9XV41_9EUKA|nr:hypothetical protein BLNAU_9737 [Blattamonas nauphoetae]
MALSKFMLLSSILVHISASLSSTNPNEPKQLSSTTLQSLIGQSNSRSPIHLQRSTYTDHSVLISNIEAVLEGNNNTTFCPHSDQPPNYHNGNSSPAQHSLVIMQLFNTSVVLSRIRMNLDEDPSSFHAASLALSSFSLRKCHVTAAPTLSPILILSNSVTSHSLSNSVVIVETSLFNRNCVVPSFVQLSPNFSSTSITISSSLIHSSFLSSRNGLAFDFNVNSTTPSLTAITSQIVYLSLSNITSHPLPTPSPFALSQSLVSSSLLSCSNHLSGSVTRDFNFGGSLLAQNTSFTSCTADPPPIPSVHDPSKNHFVGQKYASVQPLSSVSTGSIGFVKCTFNNFESTTTGYFTSIGIDAKTISCPFVISECNFVNFTSSGDPNARGAVTLQCSSGISTQFLMEKTKFENCTVTGAESHAGALRSDGYQSITISSSNFTSCSTGQYAGGMHLSAVKNLAQITNCRFIGCSAGTWGGALRVCHDSSYALSNTLFETCHVGKNGGAIDCSDGISTVSIVLCRFTACTSGSGAGALSLYASKSANIAQLFTIDLDNCTFDSCTTVSEGGAVKVHDSTNTQSTKCTLTNVVFIKCESEIDGSAVLCCAGMLHNESWCCSNLHNRLHHNPIDSLYKLLCWTGLWRFCFRPDEFTSSHHHQLELHQNAIGEAWGAIRLLNVETIKLEDCRFEDCVAEKEGGACGIFFEELVPTRTITLTRVTILDCHSTFSHTGGIYFSLAGKVVVSACVVQSSSCAVYGGGLRVQNSYSLSLSDSNFSSNEAGSSGGSVDTHQITSIEIKNCSFSDSSAITSGGALVLSRPLTATVSNCTFSTCRSRSGGAIDLNRPSTSVTLSRIVMKKCGADYAGGGLYFNLSDTAKATLSVSDVDFGKKGEGEENTCGELGADVFLLFTSSVDTSTIFTWSTLLFSSSPADGIAFTRDERLSAAFGVNETEVVLHHSILAEVHPFDDETMFVDGQNGLDESKCGLSTIPCATLPRGMEGVSDEGKIAVRTEAEITELMTLDKSVWESTGGDRARVVLAEAGSVSVESHSLSLVGLAFSAQPSSSTRARSVVTLQSGALTVQSCTFEGIHSSSSGSCIKAMLDSTDSLTITETDFTSCTSTADGGALHVTVDGGTFSTSGTITFEGCSALGNGKYLSLSSSDLVSLLKVGTLDSIKPSLPENNALFTSTQKERYFGYQSTTSKGSLLHYWYPRTSNVFRVNSEGDEHPLCGIASLPCASLEYAHDSLAQSESELILTSDIQLPSQLDAKFSTETIKCEESLKKSLTINSTGFVTVGPSSRKNVDFTLTFSSVSFLFDTTPRSLPFFRVSGGTLVFTACTFGTSTATTALPNILVQVDGGTLTMTGSTIQNMSSSSPLLSLTGGQTTLTTLDTKSIALTSTTLISLNGADLALASSAFNMITNTLGNGSILSATVPSGNTVNIEDGSATSCSTTGNGGAIFVRLSGNGKFEMKGMSGMSFLNCQSHSDSQSIQGSTGNGNCVFLGLDGDAVNFSFGKVRFPSSVSPEDPAPFLFVESDDLTTSITTTRFNFLLPFAFDEADYVKYHGMVTSEYTIHQSLVPYLSKLTEAYLSTAGDDAVKCGDKILPCESLSKALAWLIADHPDTESLPHYQVLLMNHGIHNTTIDMEEYILSVTTNKTLGTQDLTTTGSSFILGDGATEDTSLSLSNMHLKWTGAAGTFLDQSNGTVLLSACSIVIDDATALFSSSALIVKGGILTLSELTLDCNTLSTSPLLEMSGGAAGISALHISKAKLAPSLFTGSGDLTIQSSSFSSLSSSTSSSILFTLSTSSHKLHIGSTGTPVEFTSCSSSTNGGALNVAITSGDLTITETTFKKCSSSRTGGAVSVVLSGTATLRISQASFSGCRAGGDGGALHVTCSSSMDPSAVTMDADFEDCSSGSEKGNWMLLSGYDLQTLISASTWSIRPTLPLSYSSGSALLDLWGMDKAEGTPSGYEEVSLWVYLVEYSWSVVWVGSDGRDVVGCGREGWKCLTIWKGASQLLGTTAEQIVVASSTDLDRVVLFDSQDIEICGQNPRQLVRISSEGGIAVSSHDVTLRCLDVDGGDTVRSSMLVKVSGSGSVSVIDIKISRMSFSLCSLLSCSSGKVLISSSSFEGLKRSSGNGVIIDSNEVLSNWILIENSMLSSIEARSGSGSVCSGSYGDGKKIEICGTEIVSCSSSGDGGAVGVVLSGTATLRISQASFSACRAGGRGGAVFADFTDISSAQQYALLQLTFGVGVEANAAGVGKKGNDVFVVGSNFDRMILPSRWLGSFEKAEAEDLFGKDGEKEAESLLRFLLLQEVWVGRGGNDETGTGSDSMPFLSLGKGLTRIVERGEELNTVSVLEEARIGGCVVVGKETGTAQTIRISSSESKRGKIVCEVEVGSVVQGRWEERRRMIVIRRSLVIVSSLTFELRGTSKQIVSVFVVSDNAELSLADCWLTTREVVKTSFVEVGSAGSLTVSDVSCSEGRFGGKGSVVVCVGSGRVEMREVEMTSCSFEGGGVVVGGSTRGISIVDSLFRNCSGGSFGSLIRISVLGCSAEVQNCVFEGYVTRLRMDEIADVGRAVGGGCVVIELGHRRSSTRSAPHTSADLSMSSFVSCVLINTNPHTSSPGTLDFVGGSGFLIFVSDSGDHVDLSKVRVVDSVCEKMEGWGKRGFEGGVVVWRGQSLRLDRREMDVKGSSFGLVKI